MILLSAQQVFADDLRVHLSSFVSMSIISRWRIDVAMLTTGDPDAPFARLTSQTMSSIYGSAAQKTSLSQRVQSALTDLRRWKDELPESLMIKNIDTAVRDSRACYLQLMFNQVKVPAIPHIFTPADCSPKAAHHLHARLK